MVVLRYIVTLFGKAKKSLFRKVVSIGIDNVVGNSIPRFSTVLLLKDDSLLNLSLYHNKKCILEHKTAWCSL